MLVYISKSKELGNLIGEAFKMVDETGVVMMEVNNKPETSVELIEGLQYNKGYKKESNSISYF